MRARVTEALSARSADVRRLIDDCFTRQYARVPSRYTSAWRRRYGTVAWRYASNIRVPQQR